MPRDNRSSAWNYMSISQEMPRISSNHQKKLGKEEARNRCSFRTTKNKICQHLDFRLLASKNVREQIIVLSHLWWFFLYVNLTGLWCAQIFGQTWFCVCLWGVFQMQLSFKSCRLSKLDHSLQCVLALPNQLKTSVEQKDLTSSGKREFFLSDCLKLAINLSLSLDPNPNSSFSRLLSLPAFRLEFTP